jgi:hypothetical protein
MVYSDWLEQDPNPQDKRPWLVPVLALSALALVLVALLFSSYDESRLSQRPIDLDERIGVVALLDGIVDKSRELEPFTTELRETLNEGIIEVVEADSVSMALVEWKEGQLVFSKSFFDSDLPRQESSLLSLIGRTSLRPTENSPEIAYE